MKKLLFLLLALSLTAGVYGQTAKEYCYRGISKMKLNDYSGAIADFNKAIELDPKNYGAYNNRGISKAELKDYSGAIADYDKAIELDPKLADAYYGRGYSKLKLKDYNGAIAAYDKAIELDPKDARGYYGRGNSKAELKNYGGAIADYNKAIKLDPKYEDAYYSRGNSKAYLKDYGGAIADYDKAIELDSTAADVYYCRGYSKAELKDYGGSIPDYDKAIELDPKLADAYNFSSPILKLLIELDPKLADAYKDRGTSKDELKDYGGAIADYDKAIELDPKVQAGTQEKPDSFICFAYQMEVTSPDAKDSIHWVVGKNIPIVFDHVKKKITIYPADPLMILNIYKVIPSCLYANGDNIKVMYATDSRGTICMCIFLVHKEKTGDKTYHLLVNYKKGNVECRIRKANNNCCRDYLP